MKQTHINYDVNFSIYKWQIQTTIFITVTYVLTLCIYANLFQSQSSFCRCSAQELKYWESFGGKVRIIEITIIKETMMYVKHKINCFIIFHYSTHDHLYFNIFSRKKYWYLFHHFLTLVGHNSGRLSANLCCLRSSLARKSMKNWSTQHTCYDPSWNLTY